MSRKTPERLKTKVVEENMSFTEIARELNISQTRVMELYYSAMEKLIKLVDK